MSGPDFSGGKFTKKRGPGVGKQRKTKTIKGCKLPGQFEKQKIRPREGASGKGFRGPIQHTNSPQKINDRNNSLRVRGRKERKQHMRATKRT